LQATLYGTSLLQCTQITNGNPNTHILCGKRINEAMSLQLETLTVPNQVVHCLIITYTHTSDLQLFEIYQDAIEQGNVQIKTLDTMQTNLLSSFWPSNQSRSVTSGKIENKTNLPVPAESHFTCPALINAGLAKLWKPLEDNGLSKMEPSNAACRARSSTRSFPTSPKNPHQLHLNSVLGQAAAQLFTFIHQRVIRMRNFQKSVRIRHPSGGC
jgi:hypothetical protein